MCSRELTLVGKVAKIKEEQARTMMRDTRDKARKVKKTLRPLLDKNQYTKVLQGSFHNQGKSMEESPDQTQ